MSRISVYPGTFDPVTYGHLDVIKRVSALYDKVFVAVAHSTQKKPLFSVEERVNMLKKSVGEYPNVEVEDFDELVVDYAAKKSARVVVRGLRMISDFEYEFQMALMNRKLNKNVQTVFLMTGLRWIFISSSIIKEAARFGGETRGMVPDFVAEKLRQKFSKV